MVTHDVLFTSLDNEPMRFEDDRGWLEVLYEKDDLVLKRSFSKAGVFRGLHWQKPPAVQTKIIRVISGAIMDVVVDMADPSRDIRTMEIDAASGWICIPVNAAHGFYAREDTTFEYVCHGAYRPDCEVALSVEPWLREKLGDDGLILSEKDTAAQPLDEFKA
tara:strand:+ start:340 stop:825 length:486 start_codon:yes stop_codon:yes gene_type:complete